MSRPTPMSDLEWRRNMAKDVRSLQRRGAGRDLAASGTLRRATLKRSYRGPGPTQLTLEGYEELTTEAYDWIGRYVAYGSREVDLIRLDGTYRILGQSNQIDRGGWARLPLFNLWGSYNDGSTVNPSSNWREPGCTKLASGIVVLRGMIAGGVLTAGTKIAQLPEGLWPDYELVFPLEANDVRRGVGILADGSVILRGGWTGAYASLDGIAFPAAGVADWVTIDPAGAAGSANAFQGAWQNHSGTVDGGVFGPARYWVDPYGTVWYGGVVSGGTIVDNQPIFSMPAALRPVKEEHIVANTNNTYGAVGIQPTSGINIKIGSSASYVSLAGVTSQTADSYNDPVWDQWWETPPYQNGWSRFDPVAQKFPEPAVRRREDGLCQSRGMITAGTLNARVFQLPPEMRLEQQAIISAMANNARARIDINGEHREDPGSFIPVQGSNAWFSLDSVKWYPG
jgi:hypothetical protein